MFRWFVRVGFCSVRMLVVIRFVFDVFVVLIVMVVIGKFLGI